jgi:hypothetical protein
MVEPVIPPASPGAAKSEVKEPEVKPEASGASLGPVVPTTSDAAKRDVEEASGDERKGA